MNRYLAEPDLAELSTEVCEVISSPNGGFLVAGRDNLFRPEGGGQPQDLGAVEIGGRSYRISELVKGKGGLVYARIVDLAEPPPLHMPMIQQVDIARRFKLRKLHTLQHLHSAAAYRVIPDAEPCGNDLDEGAAGGWIRLRFAKCPELRAFRDLTAAVSESVNKAAPVVMTRANSIEEARTKYRGIFRLDPAVTLTGRVRVVIIQQIDANCCSALHWSSSDIGEYRSQIVPVQDQEGEVIEISFSLEAG